MIERVRIFKVGKLWVFKHFFSDRIYRLLSEFYDKKAFRYECTTPGKNRVVKLLEKNGYEAEVIEDPRDYLVSIETGKKYAHILRNSIAHRKTDRRIIFLMKDENAVEAALRQGARIYGRGWAEG